MRDAIRYLESHGFILGNLDKVKLQRAGKYAMALAMQWVGAYPHGPFATGIKGGK